MLLSDLRGRGCLQVPKEVLMTICTREQMEEIRRNSLSLMRSDITQPLVQSETDSNGCFHSNKRWIIRLEEVASEPTWKKKSHISLRYAAGSATDGIVGGRLESTNKGKEKSHRSSNWWKSVLELQMSSGYVDPGLGRADMGPKIGEVEDCVILEGDDMSKVTQHFVKDTQHFVNAAVSIFGISVVGGTIPSVCRRWFISLSVAINRLVRTPLAMV
ncbi:hypothetical protein F2Q69_00000097 [Brassica cretica]|uniref:Uncharacterized protein n=1 Tax=Brassica cretica TaxID=69181 RepID=A0A8S9PRC4_BRACR|nr:hypothetical protein F2Q69_00000097 [Brassica cretica]